MVEAARTRKPAPKAAAPVQRAARQGAGEGDRGAGTAAAMAGGPVISLAPRIQTKVTFGQRGDRFEREADVAAARVEQGERAPLISRLPAGGLQREVQRETSAEAGPEKTEAAPAQALSVQLQDAEETGPEAEEAVQPEATEELQEATAEDTVQAMPAAAEPVQPQGAGEEPAQAEDEGESEPVQEIAVQRQDKTETPAADEAVQAQPEETAVQAAEAETPVQEQEEAEATVQGLDEAESAVQEESRQTEAVQAEDEPATKPPQAKAEEAETVQEEGADTVQEKSEDEGATEAAVQEQASPGPPGDDKAAIAAEAIRSKGAGEPLTPATRSHLEVGLGAAFGEVRVHREPGAQRAAAALSARAFTRGRDIWLGPGESPDNIRLMAHEATHVVQQDGAVRRQPRDEPDEEGGATAAVSPEVEPPPPAPTAVPLEGGVEPVASAADATPSAREPLDVAGPLGVAAAPAPAAPAGKAEAVTGEAEAVEAETAEAEAEAEKAAAAEPAPAEAAPPSAEDDPRFTGVIKRLTTTARQQKSHEPAAKKVGDARAAAEPPANDRSSRAQAGQVEIMAEQEAKKPDPKSFLDLLRAAIARIAPRNMKETEDFKKKNRAAELKTTLGTQIAAQKEEASGGIKRASEAEADPASVPEHTPTPLPPEAPDPAAPSLRASDVLPLPKPADEVSVEDNKKSAEQLMAENDIDQEQLEKANEPQFTAALEAKKELDAHADKVPEAYREIEQPFLAEAKADVAAKEATTKEAMRGARERAKDEVAAKQDAAKKKEEEERKKVADHIEKIYETITKKVEDKLSTLDDEVNKLFDEGEQKARDLFQTYVDDRMSAYKWDRYISRLGGSVLWAKDKIFGMPDKVNAFYEEGRDLYLKEMDRVLIRIADLVETRLKEAKEEIANGKQEIRTYVESLPETLRKAGEDAEKQVGDKFGDLEASVESKKEDLAQGLAQRYQEAREKLDEEIEKLKAENQGLLAAVVGKIKEIIEILRNFRDRIMTLLRQSGQVIRQIVKDPIGFLGNLIGAVMAGFNRFVARIGEHLKQGLVGWLFGTMADAGIQIPSEFSAKAIFGLVLQILGLTVERLKAKLTRFIGAKNIARLEKAWSIVETLIREGPAGLWERVKEFAADLKERILGEIREFVITQVIKQGVLWVLSLLNPASALLKAIKLIYDIVMFFVNNIDRILQLVEAVIQSAAKIVAGSIGAAAAWIEQALGRMVPVMIGFLASVLGLGGLGAKIRAIIERVRRPIDRAVDKVLHKIASGVKKVFAKGKALAKKGIAKVKALFFPPVRVETEQGVHTLTVKTSGTPRLLISSATQSIHDFLNKAEKDTNIPAANRAYIPAAKTLAKDIDNKLAEIAKLGPQSKARETKQHEVIALENQLAKKIQDILKGVPLSKFDERYKLEGMVATYQDMPKQKSDVMTPDHQPQAALLKAVAKMVEFSGRKIQKVAAGHAKLGLTINLHHTRHIEGRTFGSKGSKTRNEALAEIVKSNKGVRKHDERRKNALKVIRDEAAKDSAAILTAIARNKKNVFGDIYKMAGSEKVKSATANNVKNQIMSGQSRIKTQNVDALGEM